MRIAQIAPLWEATPPATYGGTEQVVSLLTERMVQLGHEVTLFASGDSRTHARLISTIDASLRQKKVYATTYEDLRLLEAVFERSDEFDIIHNHLGALALPFAKLSSTPVITTLHGAFKPRTFRDFISAHAQLPYISISDYQRTGCPNLNYVRTIYHGLNLKVIAPSLSFQDKNYLAFLGRFSAEKGPDLAIQVAKATGQKLIMAGKIDPVDREFFRESVEPHIDGQQIQFIGELNFQEKIKFLSQARATLCPITWPEPFGLVLIESMACGTPVLALRDGSIPEIIRHEKTGFIADSVEEMISQLGQVNEIDRRVCRHHVESRFSVERMVDNHLETYGLLVEHSHKNRYHKHQQHPDAFTKNSSATNFSTPNFSVHQAPGQITPLKSNDSTSLREFAPVYLDRIPGP